MIGKIIAILCWGFFCFFIFGYFLSNGVSKAGPQEGYPQPAVVVDTAMAPTLITNQVAMTSNAAVIKAAPATGHYRYSITIKNTGLNTVWIGPANTVSKTTGYPLLPGERYTADRSYSALYGICDTALTSTMAYIEEAR
jgi:hypothetical protein